MLPTHFDFSESAATPGSVCRASAHSIKELERPGEPRRPAHLALEQFETRAAARGYVRELVLSVVLCACQIAYKKRN